MVDDASGARVFDPIRAAKRLMRLARLGALATLERLNPAPLVTLVGVASDDDGAPLLFLSTLAEHTKNLGKDPRASILLASSPRRGDPLNAPRLTLSGEIVRAETPRRRQRYLQRNPKAKLYAGLADFAIHRLDPSRVHFNGGFGKAAPLTPAELLVEGDFGTLVAAETQLLAEAEALGPEALARLAGARGRLIWRAVGLDAEGLDLNCGVAAARADWREPALTPEAWRESLAKALSLKP